MSDQGKRVRFAFGSCGRLAAEASAWSGPVVYVGDAPDFAARRRGGSARGAARCVELSAPIHSADTGVARLNLLRRHGDPTAAAAAYRGLALEIVGSVASQRRSEQAAVMALTALLMHAAAQTSPHDRTLERVRRWARSDVDEWRKIATAVHAAGYVDGLSKTLIAPLCERTGDVFDEPLPPRLALVARERIFSHLEFVEVGRDAFREPTVGSPPTPPAAISAGDVDVQISRFADPAMSPERARLLLGLVIDMLDDGCLERPLIVVEDLSACGVCGDWIVERLLPARARLLLGVRDAALLREIAGERLRDIHADGDVGFMER